MSEHRIFSMSFGKVYPLLVAKVQRKGRTKQEVDEVISWLTGYDEHSLSKAIESNITMQEFFDSAPMFNPNASKIKGVVCSVRVEEIENELMRKIRYLDKLIDELAKGKSIGKIMRE